MSLLLKIEMENNRRKQNNGIWFKWC
jgi:hypothetical protein